MNTYNKKDKSGGRKNVIRRNVVAEIKRGEHSGAHVVKINAREYARDNPDNSKSNNVKRNSTTGRSEDLTVSYNSKGNAEGYIIQFEEYEDLRDRLDALEANERIKQSGGIPHEVVKLELSGLSPLAAWRKYRGLTQQSLADSAKITQPYIAAIESGKKDGTASTLKQLAETLGTSIDNLIE